MKQLISYFNENVLDDQLASRRVAQETKNDC